MIRVIRLLPWLLAVLGFASGCPAARAASPGSTSPSPPYMGVDTWYGFGAAINQATIVSLTDAVVARGLASAGYRYVWLDAGWWHGDCAPNGAIRVDPTQWPSGMAWIAQYITRGDFWPVSTPTPVRADVTVAAASATISKT